MRCHSVNLSSANDHRKYPDTLLHVAGGYPLCVDTFQLIAVMGVLAVEVIQCGELESKEVLAVAQ